MIVPAPALHDVTFEAENCCVPLSATVALAGETTGVGVAGADGALLFTGTVSELLCHVPGLLM